MLTSSGAMSREMHKVESDHTNRTMVPPKYRLMSGVAGCLLYGTSHIRTIARHVDADVSRRNPRYVDEGVDETNYEEWLAAQAESA